MYENLVSIKGEASQWMEQSCVEMGEDGETKNKNWFNKSNDDTYCVTMR